MRRIRNAFDIALGTVGASAGGAQVANRVDGPYAEMMLIAGVFLIAIAVKDMLEQRGITLKATIGLLRNK